MQSEVISTEYSGFIKILWEFGREATLDLFGDVRIQERDILGTRNKMQGR